MKKKDILKNCTVIYSSIDDLQHAHMDYKFRRFGRFEDFGFGIVDGNKRREALLGDNYRQKEDDLVGYECDIFEVAFALGYAVGQAFDVPYPRVKKAIKSIQGVFKEEKLLPYFPREKKSGLLPTTQK
jgi:hypothetical protein